VLLFFFVDCGTQDLSKNHFLIMEGIKNIIFDLGNVLLDLDWDRTERAFRDLLREEFDEALRRYESERLFEQLEIGQLTPEAFLKQMKKITRRPLEEKAIVESWNTILVEIPPARLQWLQKLSNRYAIYLLSNTNAIHIEWLHIHLQKQAGMTIHDFNALFVKPYYSFEINLRKPNREIYEYVINDADLCPEETLFVDDMEENILSAQSVGLKTLYHQAGTEVMEAFNIALQ
jgi:FMN phosphatase YigB (HAD superfamily)